MGTGDLPASYYSSSAFTVVDEQNWTLIAELLEKRGATEYLRAKVFVTDKGSPTEKAKLK